MSTTSSSNVPDALLQLEDMLSDIRGFWSRRVQVPGEVAPFLPGCDLGAQLVPAGCGAQ